jgi:hypothetical protein
MTENKTTSANPAMLLTWLAAHQTSVLDVAQAASYAYSAYGQTTPMHANSVIRQARMLDDTVGSSRTRVCLLAR